MKISQILSENEKEFEERFIGKRIPSGYYLINGYECAEEIKDEFESFLLSSQTKLIEGLIEEVEGMKAFTDYPNTSEGNQMLHENRLYNSALQKVIDLLNNKIK